METEDHDSEARLGPKGAVSLVVEAGDEACRLDAYMGK
jgi:hypothetical protein